MYIVGIWNCIRRKSVKSDVMSTTEKRAFCQKLPEFLKT